MRVLVWAAGIGLIVAVVLAWIFEWSAGSLHREQNSDSAVAIARSVESVREAAHRNPADPRQRLVVLPFRILRPDEETDFLAFSLADAITCNLAGLRSLIVRSSLAASRYQAEPDLASVAAQANVDLVLTGSLLRAGAELEVRTQLTHVRDGALLWSLVSRIGVNDLFALQEEVTHRIVQSLSLPLTRGEDRQLNRDAPATPRAFELYLRANQLSVQVNQWSVALELYLECLREDPDYAPALARAARCHRLISKYTQDKEFAQRESAKAEAAFRRALDIEPDLALAHSLYADLEVDTNRAEQAMVRLLGRIEVSGPQPELLAGLVQACRFCGLLDASVAADRLARELDPEVRTSVAHTHFMRGDYAAALGTYNAADIGYMEAVALAALGRGEEAAERLRQLEFGIAPESLVRLYITSLRLLLEGDRLGSLQTARRGAGLQRDGEGIYYISRQLAFMAEPRDAIAGLERSLAAGYFCYPALARDEWLDSLRELDTFKAYAQRVRLRSERAQIAFAAAGGAELLGNAMAISRPAKAPA